MNNSKSNISKRFSMGQIFVVIGIALLFGFIGSVAGNYLLRKLPSTTIQQSKQVVIDQQTAVANVAKKVGPSVVSIVSSSSKVDPYTGSTTQTKDGAGTGIIVTDDGLVMTNKHVVEGGESFNIITSDNTEYKDAKVVATDPSNDLAFIRFSAKNLKAAELGDSDKVEVGQSVVAIGTVTTAHTIALTNGTVQTATLTASTACTFTMPTATAGKSFTLLLKQAASTGNGTATFTGVKYSGGTAPTITATAGKMDILTFTADGTNWYGNFSQNYTP